jgi:hypothetical protein
MPDLWYYSKDGRRFGPVPMNRLKELVIAGDLRQSDLLWSPGMAEWTVASEVTNLLPPGIDPSDHFESVALEPPVQLSAPPVAPPSIKEQMQGVQDVVAPYVSRYAERCRSLLTPLGVESQRIVAETVRHMRGLLEYATALWLHHLLGKATAQLQIVLGVKMVHAGVGDSELREQIRTLSDRIENAKAVNDSTKAMDRERRALYIRLAATTLANTAEAGTEPEHHNAVSAMDTLKSQDALLAAAKGSLRPNDRVGWRRICVGYGVMAMVFLGLLVILLK